VAKVGQITEHERLRRLRSLSVTEMALETGFSHSYVSQVEGGYLPPSDRYRAAAARVLGVPVEALFPEVARG
jgi:transcriptional regulator with XRE-family HTH domain